MNTSLPNCLIQVLFRTPGRVSFISSRNHARRTLSKLGRARYRSTDPKGVTRHAMSSLSTREPRCRRESQPFPFNSSNHHAATTTVTIAIAIAAVPPLLSVASLFLWPLFPPVPTLAKPEPANHFSRLTKRLPPIGGKISVATLVSRDRGCADRVPGGPSSSSLAHRPSFPSFAEIRR